MCKCANTINRQLSTVIFHLYERGTVIDDFSNHLINKINWMARNPPFI
jgi:hypothetical protein